MKKILVIEDEPEMRRNIVALLRYHEYTPIAELFVLEHFLVRLAESQR